MNELTLDLPTIPLRPPLLPCESGQSLRDHCTCSLLFPAGGKGQGLAVGTHQEVLCLLISLESVFLHTSPQLSQTLQLLLDLLLEKNTHVDAYF